MYSKGQTLIELIVVISISIIVVGALVFATIASLRNAQFSKYQAQATKLAQEGIEKVRSARDRNANINSLSVNVVNWNGTDSLGTGSIWNYSISSNCVPTCYFIFPDSSLTLLNIAGTGLAESIPPSPAVAIFKRYVILSDGFNSTEKTVTVIVFWTDFSGSHQSQLSTVLGKL